MRLPYHLLANPKRGLPLAIEALIATQRWLYAEALRLDGIFGYEMPLVKTMRGKAHYISDILALMPEASGIETEGQDAQRLGAEHESPAPKGDAQ